MQKAVTQRRVIYSISVALLAVFLLVGLVPALSEASSHREAPLIATDPQADTTDVYAFVSPDVTKTVTLIANYIPLEAPYGGPNFFRFADDVLYEIKVDNVGDARAHVTYQFAFHTNVGNGNTFLYNTNVITNISSPYLNVKQFYTLTEVVSDTVAVTTTVLAANLPVPPVNIGSASTPNYDALGDAGVCTISINGAGNPTGSSCNTRGTPLAGNNIKVFAGQRDDPFFVDLGSVFDLLHLRGQPPPVGYPQGAGNIPLDGLAGYNVHSLALQIPISRLKKGSDPVLGVWSTASRRSTRVLLGIGGVLSGNGLYTTTGSYVQVSRLGMPLVNEAVIPLALKDAFNTLDPSLDLTVYNPSGPVGDLLYRSVLTPELQILLGALYGVPNPGQPRLDIQQIFLQGMKLGAPFTITTPSGPFMLPAGFSVNRPAGSPQPSEMIRLNTDLRPGGGICSATPNYQLGILAGDACGFPNGRRLQDDVTDIELLAVAGAAWTPLTGNTSFSLNPNVAALLHDNINQNDVPFGATFPYLATPHSGQYPGYAQIHNFWMMPIYRQ